MKKNNIFIIIITIIVSLLILIGVTYAFFSYTNTSSKSEIITGQIYMNYEETSNILLADLLPETKEEALARNDENGVFEFSITGRNTSEKPIYYEIDLLEGDVVTGENGVSETVTKILPEHVMIYLERDGEVLVDGLAYSDWNNRRIYVDTIPANTESNISHNYTLRMWFSENITISDTNPNADYTTEEWNNSYASLKVKVIGNLVEKELPKILAKQVKETMLLTESDNACNEYVYGSDVDNNYVWYSGKLWRIVSVNCDGSIKLITQGDISGVAWTASASNTDYSISQVRTWLNEDFLSTLYNANTLVANADWDYTTYTSFPTQKIEPALTVVDKVGLLNVYDFMKTGGTNSSSTTDTFLNNGYYWWLMSPHRDGATIWCGDRKGHINSFTVTDARGIRPVINLKTNIQVRSGTGKKDDPYTIIGDKESGVINELLNNRVSGEYIKFNNVSYRIVGVEEINGNLLTKVTMADNTVNNNTLGTALTFGSSADESTYNPTYGIGLYLEEWYKADKTSTTYATTYINDTYKKMIATANDDGVKWYTGAGISSIDYKLSKTGTEVATTIGLGYYGEMFSAHFGDGYGSSNYVWLMTKYSDNSVWYIRYSSLISHDNIDKNYYVRPSFYLKSDVKIGDVDGDGKVGTGKPNDPYEIVYEFIDTTAPVCTITGDTDIMVGSTYTYNIECTDESGFSDSEITTSDITISNTSAVSISTPVKSTITNGYKYEIIVTPKASGTTTISLKVGSVSDGNGNENNAVTSSTITVTESAPVCAFTSSYYEFDSVLLNYSYVELILDCTSEDGFSDSEIASDDFEVKVNGAVDEYSYIESPVKTTIDNGYRYTIKFYYGPDSLYDISLKANSVTSSSGGGNAEVYTQVKFVDYWN